MARKSTKTSKKKERGRWTARRKREAVVRLIRGESLDALSREIGVTAARLSEWQSAFLEAGEAGLKSRLRDQRDSEIDRLKRKVGELTMDNELLVELQRLQENRTHPQTRRSKR